MNNSLRLIVAFGLIVCLPIVTAVQLQATHDLSSSNFDAIVFVHNLNKSIPGEFGNISDAIMEYSKVNPLAFTERSVVPYLQNPMKRIINAPTGPLDRDFDDSRRIYEAAQDGTRRAYKLGFKSPLLVLGPLIGARSTANWTRGIFPTLNAVMGALSVLYVPLEVKEWKISENASKCDTLGVYNISTEMLKFAYAMEEGRRIARDICGSDPERMAAVNIVKYIEQELPIDSSLRISVKAVEPAFYPLSSAVDRATTDVPKHKGQILEMTYKSGSVLPDETLILSGKGITFDSGGANIKIKNYMTGMHRDKCGAAAVVGFFKTLCLLQPQRLKVIGYVGFVRNNIGPAAYVPDEIITSLAGRRIKIVNTDAEGRMVLSDLLYYAKEAALRERNPYVFTIATLTGHSKQTYKSYSAVMDNGPAKLKQVAKSLQAAGDLISDMFEVSTIRREDYEFVEGHSEYEDLMQSVHSNDPEYARGHQFAAAFMIRASGLDEHGINSDKPIPYTHIDMYPACGSLTEPPTAVPLMALTVRYVLPKLEQQAAVRKSEH